MIVNRIVQKIDPPKTQERTRPVGPGPGQNPESEPVNRITLRIDERFTNVFSQAIESGQDRAGPQVESLGRTEPEMDPLSVKRTDTGIIVDRIRHKPSSKVLPGTGGPAGSLAGRQEIDRLINKAAARHRLPASLVKAVALAESGLDPNARSDQGAMGLMQLMPDTAREMGVENPFDPAQNLNGGTRYLKILLTKYGGDLKKALVAYNWGQGRIDRLGSAKIPAETSAFISRVLALHKNRS